MIFIGNAVLKGYGMYSLGYYPAIAKAENEDCEVVGEVYDVEESVFIRLDRMEVGAGYDRQMGEVDLSTGEKVNVTFWDMLHERLSHGTVAPFVIGGDWLEYQKENNKLEV